MAAIFVRSAYNYDVKAASDEAAIVCDPSEDRTQQQFKDDADINTIVKRFGLTGKVPVGFAMPRIGDFTNVTDFHSAMNLIVEAEEAFLEVPADIRARFGHDPQQLMRFLEDPNNREEGIKLGFFKVPDVPRET